jgi:hypothetical protein
VSLDRTIAALVPDWPALPPAERTEVIASCTGFVRAQIGLAPFHIRFGFRVLFIAFSLYAPFRSEGAGQALTSFSALPLPLVAGLERLLRASTLLAFFEHPLVLRALGEPTPAERQQTFRAVRQAGAAP